MKKAHISFILDQSSSMESVKDATISGLNEYIATLKKDKGVQYTFDLTLFDTTVTKRAVNQPLASFEGLSASTYKPGGMTALYDAVCDTIIGREGAGEKLIVVIMTDGQENSSTRYNEKDLSNMIKAMQSTGSVTFAFMGANQDAWATAQKWGMHKGNVANFVADSGGTRGAFVGMAMATSNTANMQASSNKNFFETQANTANTLNFDKDQPKQ